MKLKAQALTDTAFCRYGRFASITRPAGAHTGQDPVRFYRDLLPLGPVVRRLPKDQRVEIEP